MAKSGPKPGVSRGEDPSQRLIAATITVLARDGFVHASARSIAEEAGVANGLIFYHFTSMTGLLTATAHDLADRGIERIKAGLGGAESHRAWSEHLADVLRRESNSQDMRAVLELIVGAHSSPELQGAVSDVIGRALDFAAQELDPVVEGAGLSAVLPTDLTAQTLGATFLGLVILLASGQQIDLDRLAQMASLVLPATHQE
ncbi:MAG: TetR/AcrR family transcriptional regulator [Arachnia sp.]